jgi:hypothetical protein
MTLSGWGASSWGASPWAGAGATLQLLSVVAVRENLLRLTFNEAVYYTRWLDPFDAYCVDRYSVTAVAGTVGIDGQPPRTVAPEAAERFADGGGKVIDLWLDRALSPFGTRYLASVNGLQSIFGGLLAPGYTSVAFDGLARGRPAPTPELAVASRDIANPQTLSALLDPLPTTGAAQLGTFPVDVTGDYAHDEGLTSLKKRIFRRLTTRKGAFAHLPGYGVLIPSMVKKLAKPALVQALAADAEEQIKLEPEVADCSVVLARTQQGVYVYQVRVRTKLGLQFGVNAPAPFLAAGG